MKTPLKNIAIDFYFRDVKADKYRNNFTNELRKRTVVDKRSEGYYCCQCGKLSPENAFPQIDRSIFPKNDTEIWIANTHYYGCKGWD